MKELIGKKVAVRAEVAGVHAGTVVALALLHSRKNWKSFGHMRKRIARRP